jgi:hypothetical protein
MSILEKNNNAVNLEALLDNVLADVKDGRLTKDEVKAGLTAMIGFIDKGDEVRAVQWLRQGRSLMKAK